MVDFQQMVRERLKDIGLSPVREAEIVDEVAQHLRDRYESHLSNGVSAQEAERQIAAELYERDLARELRDIEKRWSEPVTLGADERGSFWSGLWQDVRYGSRVLRLNKAFTAVCVLSLALGVGANTAIFQLIDAVRMRTLPVKNPQELAVIRPNVDARAGRIHGYMPSVTNRMWEQIRKRQQGFTGVFAFGYEDFNLATGGQVRSAQGMWVSGEFFDVLGIQPILGRLFHREDDHAGCGMPGAVLNYRFWQREFGSDTNVVGKTVRLEGHAFPVLGVTPASFKGITVGHGFDVAVPVCSEPVFNPEQPLYTLPQGWWLVAMGRLKPGWTLEKASAQLGSVSAGIMEDTLPPAYQEDLRKKYLSQKLYAYPGATGLSQLRGQYESPLWLLLVIAGLVLVIACANLANLMLARASAREKEIAVRMALGAARGRVVRQLLTESLLLALAGALLGVALAFALSAALVRYLTTKPGTVFLELAMDWRVLGFTAGLAVLTCVLFGLAPALKATHAAPARIIRLAGRGLTATRERFSLRRGLVVTQVSLSLVLVVGALLFARSLRNILTLDAGFQRDGMVEVDIEFERLNLPPARRVPFRESLLERVRALPGVIAAADTSVVPISGYGWSSNVVVGGQQVDIVVQMSNISPGYFRTMGTPLVIGRDFDERDNQQSPKVAIVNQQFAKKFFGGDALGKTFQIAADRGEKRYDFQVVGVVRNTKYYDLRENFEPLAFYPEAQDDKPDTWTQMMVRSDLELASVINGVKAAIAQVDSGVSVDFHPYDRQIKDGLLRERLLAMLSSFFGILAAVLATIGLYGVIAYMVARRTNEIGIRMALGASPRQILAMVVGEAGSLLVVGVMIGAVLAVAAGKSASTLLYGLKPYDPLTLVLAAAGLGAVAIAASLLPARRAAKLEPMVALRDE
ncbi:MAG TPA: ABC transporter permease [Bryobacteraceae bacterium]|nr:ABC transporter permease [Bryobacteraceae bacterium]